MDKNKRKKLFFCVSVIESMTVQSSMRNLCVRCEVKSLHHRHFPLMTVFFVNALGLRIMPEWISRNIFDIQNHWNQDTQYSAVERVNVKFSLNTFLDLSPDVNFMSWIKNADSSFYVLVQNKVSIVAWLWIEVV